MFTRLHPLSMVVLLSAASVPAGGVHAHDSEVPYGPDSVVSSPSEAEEFVAWWRAGAMPLWFGKDPALDRRLRDRYGHLYALAARGELATWAETPIGALARVLLLDQFPRNAFRDTPRMYATDELARHAAARAVERGFHRQVPEELQRFFVLPFAHSESLADQDRAVELARGLTPHDLERAEHHRAIVLRFGRFPHRNGLLGRSSTAEEERYLAEGGYRG